MKTFRKILCTLIYLAISALYSCEEAVNWDNPGKITPVIVVEGMVTNQYGLNYIKLSLPFSNDEKEALPFSGAIVWVSDGDSTVFFRENEAVPGSYFPEPDVRAVANRIYHLSIVYSNHVFNASAAMIPVTALQEFSFRTDPGKEGYYIIQEQESALPCMTRYDIQWQDSAENRSYHKVYYSYTLSSVNVNAFFKPAAEHLSFPRNSRVIRTKYSLSPGHEDYIRSLLSETEWKGGWFDILPGNLNTNLTKGGVGYFAACSAVRDTVYFVSE